MAYSTATLTGFYQTFDEQAAEGVVEIIPNSRQLVDAEGNKILAGRVKVTLEELTREKLDDDGNPVLDGEGAPVMETGGAFSVVLPATDDATVEPATGRQYTVVAKLRHTHLAAVTGVELATGATVDVADVASAPVVDPEVSLAATIAQLDALEASVAVDLAAKADTTYVDTALASKQDAGDYATNDALTTGLASKADTTAVPTAPEDIGAEPAGLSTTTNTTLAATYAASDTLSPTTRPVRPAYNLVSTFQAGHGWIDMGGTSGGAVADDTSIYELGTQSYKVTVPAVGGAARTVRKTGNPAANLTGKTIAMLVRVDAPTALGNITLTIGDDAFTNFSQIYGVYGSSSADAATIRANEWQWVHFTLADRFNTAGTGGLTAVTAWQLRINGSAVSIVNAWIGAVGYFDKPTSFPNGVVSFCADDSYESQATRMAPALDKYGYAATAFNIVDKIGTAGCLTLDQLNRLHDHHGWEISGHALTTNAHDSANGFQDLTEAQLETEMRGLRAWTARHGWRGGDLMAYPKGKDSALVRKVVGKYFALGRLVTRQPYQPARVESRGLRVRSYSIDSAATSAATITALIDSAYTNGWWLVLTLHDITASGAATAVQWDLSKLQTVVDYCNTKGIPVKTIGEVLTAP